MLTAECSTSLDAPTLYNFQLDIVGNVSAGSNFKGRILLDCQAETSAECLLLRFHGSERTAIHSIGIDYNHNSTYQTGDESKKIISSDVLLHRFTGDLLMPGRYEFPFEIAIPSSLPGSQVVHFNPVGHSFGENCLAIEYNCTILLCRPGGITQSFSDVRVKVEPCVALPMPMYFGPTESKVDYMGGHFSCKRVLFGARMESITAYANENLRIDFANSEVASVRVNLVDFQIFGRFIIKSTQESFDQIEMKSSGSLTAKRILKTPRWDYIYEEYERNYSIDIPISWDNILSSSNGALSSIHYELRIIIRMPFGVEDTILSTPIIIHHRNEDSVPFGPVTLRPEGSVPLGPVTLRPEDSVPLGPVTSRPVHCKYAWADIRRIKVARAQRVGQPSESDRLPVFPLPTRPKAIVAPTIVAVAKASTVFPLSALDTVDKMIQLLAVCDHWQKCTVLKDWLSYSYSPTNKNLLTPEILSNIFKYIGDIRNLCPFIRLVGEAMKSVDNCTCKRISAAANALPYHNMKPIVCYLFACYYTDKWRFYKELNLPKSVISCINMNYSYVRFVMDASDWKVA